MYIKTKKYQSLSSMDCRERGCHARGVYLTQDTSNMMGATRVIQEDERELKRHMNNRKKRSKKSRNNMSTK